MNFRCPIVAWFKQPFDFSASMVEYLVPADVVPAKGCLRESPT